jgi:DNA-binding MarR family transcriptional regulator
VCTALRQAARRVTGMYDAALAEAGLSITNYALLAKLDAAGEAGVSELAELAVMDRTTLTRNLQPLLRDGFVVSHCRDDRRRRALQLTPKGRAALRDAFAHWRRAQRDFERRYGAERARALVELLDATLEVA